MGLFSSLKNAVTSKKNKEPKQTDSPLASKQNSLTDDGWREKLTVSLRKAEPRLSIWLDIVLTDLTKVDETLWRRLEFLLASLGATDKEAQTFTQEFALWTKEMGYAFIADFQSELQYRLALALDLEDENDERNRLVHKIHTGLKKTREHFNSRLNALFSHHETISKAFWEELEEAFIMSDIGVEASNLLINRLKKQSLEKNIHTPEELRSVFAEELEKIFKTPKKIIAVNPPEVILVVGVNGVGKTTTIAKLAYRMRLQGKKPLIVAADTFRAAATDQLEVWAKKIGVPVYSKDSNADPASVAWEALDLGTQKGFEAILIDTAGRLHTKRNLMNELIKIRSVIQKKRPDASVRSILVLDATSGQNALQQTKIFQSAVSVDEIILTKLDGTAKGGVAIAVALTYNIPIAYVGLGEKMEDLRPFDGSIFAQALLSNEQLKKTE